MNPRRESNEHVKVITLRGGRELAVQGLPPMIEKVEIEEVTQTRQDDKIEREQPQEKKSTEEETEAKY